MQFVKLTFIKLGSVALMFLAACGNGTEATNPDKSPSPAATTPSPAASLSAAKNTAATTSAHPKQSQGGQVIESGPYHLEFVAAPENNGIHLDFYLQKGDNHEAIPDATVTAQVQMPTGEQKTLDLAYDAAGKHYAVFFPEKAVGEYKIVILSNIKGEKVNGRFTFTR